MSDKNVINESEFEKVADELWNDYKNRREQDPRYKQYEGHKAIPFSYELGFFTVTIESPVLKEIEKHLLQHDAPRKVFLRVEGVLFGLKTDSCIQINQSFQGSYTKDGKILTEREVYNTDMEFLGIYSNGSIPDEMDMIILEELCQTFKQTVFLVKVNWCPELNDISTTIYENVYDIVFNSFDSRIISMQAFSHHPKQCILNQEDADVNIKSSNRIYYITFFNDSMSSFNRFLSDISEEQKLNIEKGFEAFGIDLEYPEYKDTLSQLSISEGMKSLQFIDPYESKDYVKLAKEFCHKAKLELRFNFSISLERKMVICQSSILNYGVIGICPEIRESQNESARNFLSVIGN